MAVCGHHSIPCDVRIFLPVAANVFSKVEYAVVHLGQVAREGDGPYKESNLHDPCLLYTSDAADE